MTSHRRQRALRIAETRRRRDRRRRARQMVKSNADHGRPDGFHFDRDGWPISMAVWCVHFEDDAYRRVAFTRVSADVEVSTIWRGLAAGFANGAPLIFHTAVRHGGREGTWDEWISASTEAEALQNHAAAVSGLRNAS